MADVAGSNVAAPVVAAPEPVVPLAAPTATVVVDASAPPQTFAPEIAAHAATLGVDLTEFSGVAPDVVSRMLTSVERSAGKMALSMLGQPAAMPNPAPVAPAPPEPVAPPRIVPADYGFKVDLPDPDKMDEGYGDDVKKLVRGVRALVEDHNRRFGAIDTTLARALPALDDLHNERVENNFDTDLAEVVSAVPSLATIYGTGASRKLKADSPELASRRELFQARQRFGNSEIAPSVSTRMLAQAIAEKKTGQPTTPARNDKGQFVPTQTTPPAYTGRPAAATPDKPATRSEVVAEIAARRTAEWAAKGIKV